MYSSEALDAVLQPSQSWATSFLSLAAKYAIKQREIYMGRLQRRNRAMLATMCSCNTKAVNSY